MSDNPYSNLEAKIYPAANRPFRQNEEPSERVPHEFAATASLSHRDARLTVARPESADSLAPALAIHNEGRRSQAKNDPLHPWRIGGGEKRHFRRWRANKDADLKSVQANRPCTIFDISPSGALVQLSDVPIFWTGSFVVLHLHEFGPIAAEVRYITNALKRCGLKFLHNADGQAQLAGFLTTQVPQAPAH